MDVDCSMSIFELFPCNFSSRQNSHYYTVANALFTDIFLLLGFPSVLQSDGGGEWLNALLHRLTKLLSIKQVFTSVFFPRPNGVTEHTHRFLNVSLGIYCEQQQEEMRRISAACCI